MRVTIKGADFSNVSIGKVEKDLTVRMIYPIVTGYPDFFINYNGGNVQNIDYYIVSDGSLIVNTADNRLGTDFIEVAPGMTITLLNWGNSATVPSIVYFDANKELITSHYKAQATDDMTDTVPEGAKYCKLFAYVNQATAPHRTSVQYDLTIL